MRILEIREYRGKNIYSHYPVVKAIIDLEDLANIWSDQIPGFAEKLARNIPQLQGHHCSRGREGGFLERVKEGTMFGHIVEHVALELQYMAGFSVIYGKTVATDNPGIYEVIVEAEVMEAGIQALKSALHLIQVLINNRECNVHGEIEKIRQAGREYGFGPSTQAIIEECRKRDIPVMPLGKGSLLQLGYGIKQQRVQATITGLTSCISVDIAGDKNLTKQLLAEGGIPVPWGDVARTEDEAVKIAVKLGDSVVVKPCNGNQGKGVTLNLKSEAEIRTAFRIAKEYSEDIIVEKYIVGKHYRLLVVGNKMVAAAERIPAHVIGDGIHSVEQLIELANQDPSRGEEHEKPLTKIKIDPAALLVLAKQKMHTSSVPEFKQVVYLRENANLSTGGTAVDVTEEVHPEISQLAVRAARIIGLDVAGVDLVTPDIKRPLDKEGAVIEINAAPGIRMHHFPSRGISRNAAGAIVDYLFPQGHSGRIPVVSITGTNGKTTTARLVGHIAGLWGKCVGLTTTGGVFVGRECLIKGDTTGPRSAQAVLRDSRVEIAVLETARGGILRSGLGYDKATVGVITNISEDHLGLDGIRDLKQLAHAKALVIEALVKQGTAVLNADDPWSMELASRVKENLLYFSLAEDNLVVKRHLSTGQKAVFLKKDQLVYAVGDEYRSIVAVEDIPLTVRGRASFNTANALAAAAACISLGIPLSVIKEGLQTFNLTTWHNTGRCELYQFGGIRVLLDYAHNPAAIQNVLQYAKKMEPRRLLGVLGVPGDRRDRDIMEAGRVAGNYLDYCVVKEDQDLRGRRAGEAASLLWEGFKLGTNKNKAGEIILPELTAVLAALSKCKPGDLLVILYEKLEPLQELLHKLESRTAQEGNLSKEETPWGNIVEETYFMQKTLNNR
ncbi:MAG: cyanophycin synthetase [Peptococcaceae bacterium]|jgi:cyanophycin synthetase|nr:cyanophycin synthetase [Peptococcaceae bacterium]